MISRQAKTVQAYKIPDAATQSKATRIYVVRPSFYGTAVTANIYENNSIVGRVGPKAYIAWDSKAGDITLQSGLEFIKILAQPGKTYYFSIQPKILSFNKSTAFYFIQISTQEGINYISKLTAPKVKVVS